MTIDPNEAWKMILVTQKCLDFGKYTMENGRKRTVVLP